VQWPTSRRSCELYHDSWVLMQRQQVEESCRAVDKGAGELQCCSCCWRD
jgi:hypothetical protein